MKNADVMIPGSVLQTVELSTLFPSPLNSYEAEDIDDLAGNIKACGLLTPLTVSGPDKDGKYEILAGERRFRAINQINKEGEQTITEIPCYVCGTSFDQLEKRLIIESSNLETREFDKNKHRFEIIGILKDMAENGDIKYNKILEELGKYMHCSPRYQRMYLEVFNNNNPELNKLIEDKQVTVSLASRIAGMDKEVQDEAVSRIQNGEKPKDVIQDYTKKNTAQQTTTETVENAQTAPAAEADEVSVSSTNPVSMYDEDNFNDLINNGSIEEMKEALFNGASKVESDLDSVGQIRQLKSSDAGIDQIDEEKLAKTVIHWCKKMMKKTVFTATEEEAFEAMKEVLEYVNA